MRWDVVLANALKLTLVLGDAINSVEARSGTMNVAPGRANVTVNMTKKGKKTASPCGSDGIPGSRKRLGLRGMMGLVYSRFFGCREIKSNKTGNYKLTY